MTTADPSDRARVDRLLKISRLMLGFKDVSGSIDDALAVAATTLPLRTVILLDVSGVTPTIYRWPSGDEASDELTVAEAHARAAYDMLVGTDAAQHLSLTQEPGKTALPKNAPATWAPGETASRFIALPLLLQSDEIFGLLQVEAAKKLELPDLAFVNTVTDLFALALDRRRAQRIAVERRDRAEAAEGLLHEQIEVTRAMTDSLVEGVLASDAQGRITFINRAASLMLGREQERTHGAAVKDILMVASVDGAPVEPPLLQVLRTGEPIGSEALTVFRVDGSGFVADVKAAPIVRGGRITGAVVAFADVTEQRRTFEERSFLLAAEEALSGGLDVRRVLQGLARIAVPMLCDLCVFYVLAPNYTVRRVGWAHVDPAHQASLDAAFADDTAATLTDHPIRRVVSSRQPELVTSVDELWLSSLPDAQHAALLRSLRVRSALTVPMRRGVRFIGALAFFRAGSGRRFHSADVELFEELARRAAVAVENSQLYEDARSAVRTRDQVLEVVSHDLKSPLGAIMMGVENDQRRQRIDPDAARLATLDKIAMAAVRMRHLVDDLLDYASIDAGTLSIMRGTHDVAPIVQEALAFAEPEAHKRGVRLSSVIEEAVPPLWCDRDRVLQVLSNLLGNAVKITPLGGAVVLRAAADGPGVQLAVRDTGPGIDKAKVPHLFERFWRGDGVGYKGTGLGLAICKAIVEAHGGSIHVDSPPGEGATFTVRLPAASSSAAPPTPGP